ncbi:AAA family ATPase [Streptomyces fagopyri]|uniref:AAA family ATPase n=1 Tax=Streptomyces fagopyri TaxID=2662397 RepID=A0A5Q0LKG1_9ACTN|nr:AAA family ATPase [Streptomyces fagopyri]QFZ77391.1 AAA family ATPase [Streptomyces fagopyri]
MTDSAIPFILPGPPPQRDTAAGWQSWRTSRDIFKPAPRLDRAAWRALSARRRTLHDLHRAATHANLPLLDTPMSRAVAKLLNGRIESNALKHKPTTRAGVMITGGGYQGKTESTCEVAAAFEDRWLALHHNLNPDALLGTRDLHAPVAYVQTPVTAKPKSTCKAILSFYGAETTNMDLPDLVRQVAASLHDHGTKALLLDDITRLRMHRADDQDTLDLIRAFMSMNVTLVLVGVDIPASGLLREGRHDPRTGQVVMPPSRHANIHGLEATQTERRFDLVELDRFRYDTDDQIAAWIDHLAGVENELRLMNAPEGMLTAGTMPEYLYQRTDGVVGLLERLMEDGCRDAIETGKERLTEQLLENITIDLAGAPGRDPGAGEVPPVPPRHDTSRRRRNTVFDDRGPAATKDVG